MATFNGQLTVNEAMGSLINQIVSQLTFSPDFRSSYDLVDKARVDGGMYGDTKLYTSVDILPVYDWSGDDEAANLLQVHRPADPKTQAIKIDVFKQIPVTVDYYLTKRAFSNEGDFSAFNSAILKMLNDSKHIYDLTTYNTYIGTTETDVGAQDQTLTLVALPTTGTNVERESAARLRGQQIAKGIADVFDAMKDVGTDFNDNEFTRVFDDRDLVVVWNKSYVNEITKVDLPTIFHNEELVKKLSEDAIPARYFGDVNASSGTTGTNNTTVRSLIYKVYGDKLVKAGDLLPNSTAYAANETYTVNPKIICKIMHKDSVPYMSGWVAETNFINPKALNENHYLTWSHNTLEYLAEYPFVTIKEA